MGEFFVSLGAFCYGRDGDSGQAYTFFRCMEFAI
jgi:hypothetical protein